MQDKPTDSPARLIRHARLDRAGVAVGAGSLASLVLCGAGDGPARRKQGRVNLQATQYTHQKGREEGAICSSPVELAWARALLGVGPNDKTRHERLSNITSFVQAVQSASLLITHKHTPQKATSSGVFSSSSVLSFGG